MEEKHFDIIAHVISFGIIIILALSLILSCLWVVVFPLNCITVKTQIAQIEQLRTDIESLDGSAISEDVIGQATEWNQKISKNRSFNDMWVIGWWVPDDWRDVELIDVTNKD